MRVQDASTLFSTDRKRWPDLKRCECFKNQWHGPSCSGIDRTERARIDLLGMTKGLSTTRNTSSLNHSNNSQPLNPKPPAQTHTQYCLVRKNSWFGVAWLIDRVPSFPRPIVAGSLFDSSNISFASKAETHEAYGSARSTHRVEQADIGHLAGSTDPPPPWG